MRIILFAALFSLPIVAAATTQTLAACSTTHPPFCSNICTGSAPCAPLRNYRLGRHHVKPHAPAKSQAAKSSQ
jgi:hypothetical protein